MQSVSRSQNFLSCDQSLKCLRGELLVSERQRESTPDIRQCLGELIDQSVVMPGRWRNSQALGALRHGRIIDRLDVDAVSAQQQVACSLYFCASPTTTGMMCVSFIITGSAAALSAPFTRAARSWCWSRSHCDVLRWRIATVVAAQMAGGNAVARLSDSLIS